MTAYKSWPIIRNSRPADHNHVYGGYPYVGADDPDFLDLDFDEYLYESSYDSSLSEN